MAVSCSIRWVSWPLEKASLLSPTRAAIIMCPSRLSASQAERSSESGSSAKALAVPGRRSSMRRSRSATAFVMGAAVTRYTCTNWPCPAFFPTCALPGCPAICAHGESASIWDSSISVHSIGGFASQNGPAKKSSDTMSHSIFQFFHNADILGATMRYFRSFVALAILSITPSLAQLAPPNEAGVTLGHFHLIVTDVEAQKH